jgi:hypothetical protein
LLLQKKERESLKESKMVKIHTLYNTLTAPQVDVIFVHGLQLWNHKTAYETTWVSQVNEEGCKRMKVLWPREWLPSEQLDGFKEARILSVSYNSLPYGLSDLTLQNTAKALVREFVDVEKVGQRRPVILVGHSLGGLIIKMICNEAIDKNLGNANMQQYVSFLSNIRGIFCYATPHKGSNIATICRKAMESVHMKPSRTVHLLASDPGAELEKLSCEFRKQKNKYKWKVLSLAESCRTFVSHAHHHFGYCHQYEIHGLSCSTGLRPSYPRCTKSFQGQIHRILKY